MGIIKPTKNRPPVTRLARNGVNAIICTGGGILMLLLSALPPVFGIAAGVIALAIGGTALASRDKEDKRGGAVLFASGVAAVLLRIGRLPVIKVVAGTALTIGAFILLGFGIWNAVRFFLALRDNGSD